MGYSPTPVNDPQFNYAYFRVNNQYVKVDFDSIVFLESKDDFVNINLIDGTVITPHKLYLKQIETEQILPTRKKSDPFMRVQRSYIIALNKITAINKNCSSIEIADVVISVPEKYRLELRYRIGLEYPFR